MFPVAKFSYEYDKFSGMHLIQVKPLVLYDFDDKYKETETKVSIDFDNVYYPESVLFISDNSLNQVRNSEYELQGMFFGLEPMIHNVISPSFLNLNQDPFEAGINNYALAA